MTILVVDDNEKNLYQLQVLLGGNGYHVVTAAHGAEALAKGRQNPPDLIISDILMPVMDGFSLCREWKKDERLRQVPFVFYTATYIDERDREFALSLGAVRFIVKPEDPEVFLRTIQATVREVASPAAAAPGLAAGAPPPRPAEVPEQEEAPFLRQYNEALIRKLEAKTQQLEQANRELERDLAERKRTEEQLRQQAALLDAANDTIYVRTLDHRLTYWNKGAERSYGWTRAEALGRKITELGQVDDAAFEAAHAALLAQGYWSGELKKVSKAGKEFVVFCRWTLLRDEQGQPREVLVINTDITEHKKLEAQLLRTQRLESIGALASGIAHDLNNILVPMRLIAPLLRDTVRDDDSRAMLTTIESCAQRGSDIIKQLLVFARGTPGARAVVPMGSLLRDMARMIQETFPRHIRTVMDSPTGLWPLIGDATQLHQVLMNLCLNARDAMPDGGTLTLRAKNVTVDETFASMILGARSGAYVCVSVTDTGTGISPENLERIFDPFFTTKEIGKGTGLGLPMVLGIVRGHGGFVRVESRLGHGTTFQLHLPASPETLGAALAGQKTPPPRAQGELILVVDDEAAVRDSVRRTLESQGYRVLTATQGAEGLAVFSNHATEIRAVLADMMMPVMNGPAMIAVLRHVEPRLIILGMTGLPDRTGVKGLESLDLPALLTKPFSADELLRTLHAALLSSATSTRRQTVEPA